MPFDLSTAKPVTGGFDLATATPTDDHKPNSFVDAARSIPGGLAQGVTGMVGLPSTALNFIANKAGKLAGREEIPDADARAMRFMGLPTTGQANKAITDVTGDYYQPKTTAGRYAETVAEFAPSALSPGSAAARFARVVVPAAASETAGHFTKGTALEPYARALGAVLGGGTVEAARNIPNAIANARAVAAVPSSEALRNAASTAYQRADNAGVVINRGAMQRMASNLGSTLTDAGIDQTLHPRAIAAFNRIKDAGADTSLGQMDILRRVAGAAAGSADADERRIGRLIIDHVDDFVQNLSPADVSAGNAPQAAAALTEARDLWARQAKGGQIDKLIDRAQTRAETVGGSGLENALRVQFRQLAMNDARMRRFSPDEQAAITNVARGGPIGNAMRLVGKLAPTHAITALAEMGGIATNPAALAVPVAGVIGRVGATAATLRNAKLASALARNGAPVPQIAPDVSKAALLSQLLNSQAAQ